MSHITTVRGYTAWQDNLDCALEIVTSGANVQMTGGNSRFTLTPPAARQLAAILLAKADEAAGRATDARGAGG